MDVVATQVEGPGNVVECREKHTVAVLLAQLPANAGELVAYRLTGIFQRMDADLVARYLGTAVPNAL